MYASGFFTAGLIVGISFGVMFALGAVMIQHVIHSRKYQDKSNEANYLRQVARAAKAVHRSHHERTTDIA
jgi:hypothetical protein